MIRVRVIVGLRVRVIVRYTRYSRRCTLGTPGTLGMLGTAGLLYYW